MENETETSSLEARMLRAAKLEASLYDEVKADTAGRAVGLWVVVAIPAALIYLFAYLLQ